MWLDLRSLWEAPGALSLSIEPGSISISGQSTTFATNLAQSTQGSVTFQGQSAAFTFNEALSTNGSISVGGQSITFTIGLAEGTQGSITFQGQTVTPALGIAVSTPGSIGLTGQSFTTALGLAISTQGSMVFDGQSLTLNLAGNLTLDIDFAGSVFLTGQALTLFVSDQTITTATPSGGGGSSYRCPQGWVWDAKVNACRKLRLIDQPHRHLKQLLDEIGAEILYGELTQPAASAETQAKAAKLVKPFSDDKKAAVPDAQAIDWAALERDAKRTASLVKLWLAQQNEQELQNDDDEWMMFQ